MSESLFFSGKFVTVAVALDKHTEPLALFGAEVARRLGKKLCLLHVVDSMISDPITTAMGIGGVYWNALPLLESQAKERAQRHIDDVAKMLPAGLNVKTVVAAGSTLATLVSQAEALDSCLLVARFGAKDHRPFPAGFSTGMALLANATTPTLVVDSDHFLPRFTPALRMLLADDLTPQSEGAVSFAAAMADSLRPTHLHHVHVSALREADLQTAIENAAAAARAVVTPAETSSIFAATIASLKDKLVGRFAEFREYLEASGGEYTAEVATGDVHAELAKIVDRVTPDILVFGRHKVLHTKPLHFGQLPYKSMLGLKRPVLVVPSN